MIKTFQEFMNEASDNKIADLTGANKSVSKAENKNKFFVIREWTKEEITEFGEYQTIKQGKWKWNIIDNITPDYKHSFPINDMRNYVGNYTTQIQVKYALQDIGNGMWKPEK